MNSINVIVTRNAIATTMQLNGSVDQACKCQQHDYKLLKLRGRKEFVSLGELIPWHSPELY